MSKPRGGWVHHAQQRSKWLPTFARSAIILTIGGYFLFMLSLTRTTSQLPDSLSQASSLKSSIMSPKGGLQNSATKETVAYVISVTADGPYMDGAAVLAHGIRKASAESKYGTDFIAIIHPNVTSSRPALKRVGWKLIERGLPLEIGEIKGAFLRQNIVKNGCCGASELLKLYAWMLTDYHRVVHLDMDSLVLQSMDELFDMEMDLIYTCDYGMMTPHSKACPVQGGFFILRPDPEHYENMVGIVKEGEFNDSKGWGASGIGWFWGGMTIQGLLPYYFLHLSDKRKALEVDRCVYNNMFDNPECKNISAPLVKNVHFTVCQKPWTCYRNLVNVACNTFFDRWHALRTELEMLETGNNVESCQHGRYQPMAFLKGDPENIAEAGATKI